MVDDDLLEPVWSVLLTASQGIDRLDAEVLLAHHLGCTRMEMLLDPARLVKGAGLPTLLARRMRGEPVAYITGHREFWSLDLLVTPDVLIPRPDSETLIEAAVEYFQDRAPPRTVLDLGTGSGALLLAALSHWPLARGVGIDASEAALAVARRNAQRLTLSERATFGLGDWHGNGAAHDLILCNPPYVATTETLPSDVIDWEPHGALFAGPEGLDDYRRIAPLLGAQLEAGGVACIEIGATQAEAVTALFGASGMRVGVRHDLAGLSRCLIVTK